MNTIRSVCVYCGSSGARSRPHRRRPRARPVDRRARLRLVYGGGTRGIMGAVASGVLSNGDRSPAIIPNSWWTWSDAHSLGQLNELIVTRHACPQAQDVGAPTPSSPCRAHRHAGGDRREHDWAQLGRHEKPMVFANINGFWNRMLELLRHMREQGFIHTAERVLPLVIDNVEDIIPAILEKVEGARDLDGGRRVITKL